MTQNITSIKMVSLFVCLALLAGIIGSYSTANSITEWYLYLEKPALNPPNWIFGPVWTILYILIGVSAYLFWKSGGTKSGYIIWTIQLILNTLWTLVFFGARRPDLALVVIAFLLILILYNILLFYKVNKWAGLLLIPYLLWVSFATYLNFGIWQLN